MSTTRPPTRWNSVRGARRQVKHWRSSRRRCFGAAAWARVLDLAGASALWEPTCVSGAKNRTARSSRLPPASLDRTGQGVAPAFVELFPSLPAGPSECTIEVVEPNGRKLTVSLRGAPGSDLVALAQSLWGATR
jgi:hypothetical protein